MPSNSNEVFAPVAEFIRSILGTFINGFAKAGWTKDSKRERLMSGEGTSKWWCD